MVTVNYLKSKQDVITVQAGELIFDRGDQGEVAYGVLTGHVQIVYNDQVIDTVAAGDVLGEDVILGRSTYANKAVALTDCTLTVLDRSDFLWLVQETPTFATQVMGAMSDRVEKVASLLE